VKLKIIMVILFSLTYSIFFYFKTQDTNKKINFILNQNINNLETYSKIIHGYFIENANVIGKAISHNKKVTNTLLKEQDSDNKMYLRDQLYKDIKPLNKRIRRRGIKELHFVLANNKSFLRVDNPKHYGDEINTIAYNYVNNTKNIFEGFEKGEKKHAFRYVVPLFSKPNIDLNNIKNRYLGAVGISFPVELFQKDLFQKTNINSQFLINIDKFQELSKTNNKVSIKNYAYSLSNKNCRKLEKSIPLEIKQKIKQGLLTNNRFAVYIPFEDTIKIIMFLPIKNTIQKKVSSYLVGYSNNPDIYMSLKHHKKMTIIIFVIFSLLFYFIYIILNQKRILKEQKLNLEKEKKKAEENTKLKSEFLANMSHEIRTPMHAIVGMSYLILKSDLSVKQKNYISKIDNSAKSLLSIINDILDLSKIEAEKMEIEKIDFVLSKIMKNIKDTLKLKVEEKGLEFNIIYDSKEKKIFFGDPIRLNQILINLVNNAIKFTQKGKVEIFISFFPNNIVRFTVQDTGIGLSEEQIAKLFQSFTQADGSITRKYGGTGLGLSISKQLVELMDGKIWVESKLKIGSKFIFEIDFPEGDVKNIKKDNHILDTIDITTLQKSNILLVEDTLINQEVILGLLENSKLNIDIANNGQEGVEKYKLNPTKYKLISMDLQMPIMDGFEATKIIRKLNKNIPIIALTANAMKDNIIKSQSIGMNEHLSKPINIDEFYSYLLKYLPIEINNEQEIISNKEKEEKKEFKMIEFKIIDTKVGLEYVGGNEKIYLKILNDFYNNYKELKLESLDEEELKLTAHTIKGLAALIGASSLNSISKQLDNTLDKSLFPKFHEELNIVLEDLERLKA
jgi:signal transduction histidine kinase/ActR/RegA family two-component response regulator